VYGASQVEPSPGRRAGPNATGTGVADERVLGAERHPDRGVGDREEEPHHEQGADQAELLADHREDEVGVRLGQVAPLLGGGTDALAEPAAAGQRVEAVRGLPA